MLPNFLLIGMQKSGTSSLRYYLDEHPDIYIYPKEIHFFCDRDGTYRYGKEFYSRFFEQASREKAVGECSPCYIYIKSSPIRINSLVPEAKLVVIMRNPIDRAYSDYWKNVQNGEEKLSFEEAIKQEKERLNRDVLNYGKFGYVSKGFYDEHIHRYLRYFSNQKMLFLIFEEFVEKPRENLRLVYEFLDVDPSFENTRINEVKNPARMTRSKILFRISKRKYPLPSLLSSVIYETRIHKVVKSINAKFNVREFKYPAMKIDTRRMLFEKLSVSTENLSKIIGKDLSFWGV